MDDCLVSVLCNPETAGPDIISLQILVGFLITVGVMCFVAWYVTRHWRLEEERQQALDRERLEAWVAEDPENRKMPPEPMTIRIWG